MAADKKILEKLTPNNLSLYLREISKIPPITPDEEKALGWRIQKNSDEEALNTLVTANLKFVVSLAKKYRNSGIPFLDLINEGNLGLIEAAKRFDPTKNVKFITYAVWWIRQAIIHAMAEQGRMIRLPVKKAIQLNKINGKISKLKNKLDRNPSIMEIAQEMELEPEEIESLIINYGPPTSLNMVISEDGNYELGDIFEQVLNEPVDEKIIRESLTEQIRSLIKELNENERTILIMRYGLDGEEPKTLKEVGEYIGLSRERVRQIENQAKLKLRKSTKCRQLLSYIN
ncbi:MAG: sigma-70 family RNA polymerase sigma factor [Acidobacteria bacterium]|nr:sigma-70 family RNA polymerase sigma factor [Acidobacteriota bacterium]